MPKESKHTRLPNGEIGAIISDKVGNHENHPFFVKKAEDAKAFLKAHGLPKQLGGKASIK